MGELPAYDGVDIGELAARLQIARVVAHDAIDSTMDAAHELARAGAGHGTVVLADEQTHGRGRERREWRSPPGGVWLTTVLRSVDAENLGALPLRVGLVLARELDSVAGERVSLKWPNDLYLAGGKVGGILVEARWRRDVLDWAVIGVGVNRIAPRGVDAAGVGAATSRAAIVERIVPALLSAVARTGQLSETELAAIAERDIARGRTISHPAHGVVRGVTAAGALLVETGDTIQEVRSGSLVFADPDAVGRRQRPTANSQ